MATVVLLGTLDTKAVEYAFVRDRLVDLGCGVITVNAGVLADPDYPIDYGRRDVAAAVGVEVDDLAASGDRGAAVKVMADGSTAIVDRLWREGHVDGLLGMGGSGGSSIAGQAMRHLPVGVPKLLVSTMGAGNVAPYVGASDVAVMYSVADISGINSLTERIFENAAAAMAGMAKGAESRVDWEWPWPIVGASMYGATTPCVDQARSRLEASGYEVLVFHATGTGGRSMEALMSGGIVSASLDVTTAELMAEICGGTFTAGPDRLETAAKLGIPHVVSVGGADMVAFTPPGSLPERYRGRKLYQHNPHVTLMRTTPEECARFGELLARRLGSSHGPATLFLPLRGTSSYAVPGAVFHDPEADSALFDSIKTHLSSSVELVELDTHINHSSFGDAMARRVVTQLRASSSPG